MASGRFISPAAVKGWRRAKWGFGWFKWYSGSGVWRNGNGNRVADGTDGGRLIPSARVSRNGRFEGFRFNASAHALKTSKDRVGVADRSAPDGCVLEKLQRTKWTLVHWAGAISYSAPDATINLSTEFSDCVRSAR